MGLRGQTVPGFSPLRPWESHSYTAEGAAGTIINDNDSKNSYILNIYYSFIMLSAEYVISFSFQNNSER